MQQVVFLIVLITTNAIVEALVQPLVSLPRDLENIFDKYHRIGDLKQQSGELVFWNSMQEYMCKFTERRFTLTDRENEFLRNKIAEFMRPLIGSHTPGSRVRRQAAPTRIRREIRMLGREERQRYFDAVNALKRDTRLSPNVYDVLSDFHGVENNVRAHFGPAFPAWHRLFLWIFESFLQLYDPTVTVPYWASVLDNEMTDPTQSVIWSPAFFGNGVGEPETGPFSNWKSLNPDKVFTRNIGNGQLYSYEGIDAIVNKSRSEHILLPTARVESNFELQHGGPHVFVGGTMIRLNTAVRDPVFFNHHAFVDEIWERFRSNQIANGVDPETDYPFIENDVSYRTEHGPNGTMGFFPNNELDIDYINSFGYSNTFSDVVQYEPVPSCPDCGSSVYLYCDQNIWRCVSRTVQEMDSGSLEPLTTNRVQRSLKRPLNPGSSQRFLKRLPNSERSRRFRTSVNRFNYVYKSYVQFGYKTCPKPTLINDVPIKQMFTPAPKLHGQHIDHDWVYIPVKVVSKRTDELQTFKSYSFDSIHISRYEHGSLKKTFLVKSSQFTNQKCQQNQDVAGKIKIVSYGLNYNGYAEEYVLVDNRLGLSVSYGFVPVRRPSSVSSDVIISAFDSCGRVCKPFCRRANRDVAVTGGIRVTSRPPLQYSASYGEATMNVWQINSPGDCPSLDHGNIPLSFFCEYTDPWVWSFGGIKSHSNSWKKKSNTIQQSYNNHYARSSTSWRWQRSLKVGHGSSSVYNPTFKLLKPVQAAASRGTNINIFNV